jgi:hypothetical protein
LTGAQVEVFCNVMVKRKSTPAARPVDAPMLRRRSRRTMPDWLSTSGPLEPSAG